MASSLSSVPPVKLNPRPDTIGTFNPQAAKAGASTWKKKCELIKYSYYIQAKLWFTNETLSPTPPVLCLSTNSVFHSSGHERVSPIFIVFLRNIYHVTENYVISFV